MTNKFELRVDKVRLRGDGRNTPALQEKYIVRSANGAYTAVDRTEEAAINTVLRTMGQHYRRFSVSGNMASRIMGAINNACERIPGGANDIRTYPVSLLGA
ncbi:MAG TPA: hypothetical protein VIN59_04575 [Alphaproteobacteria bacterium]